jgi:hypothetical protein
MSLKNRNIPHSIPIFILATFLVFIYLLLVVTVALSTVNQEFRGFLVSKSLRVSEFRLPAWSFFQTSLLPGDRVVSVSGKKETVSLKKSIFNEGHPARALEFIQKHTLTGDIRNRVEFAVKRSIDYLILAFEACYEKGVGSPVTF